MESTRRVRKHRQDVVVSVLVVLALPICTLLGLDRLLPSCPPFLVESVEVQGKPSSCKGIRGSGARRKETGAKRTLCGFEAIGEGQTGLVAYDEPSIKKRHLDVVMVRGHVKYLQSTFYLSRKGTCCTCGYRAGRDFNRPLQDPLPATTATTDPAMAMPRQ